MSKDTEVIYVVEDWFDYNCDDFTTDADAYPVAATKTLDTAKNQAHARADQAVQEFVEEDYDKDNLSVKEFKDNEHDNVEYALGVYDEEQGLLEQIKVFKKELVK